MQASDPFVEYQKRRQKEAREQVKQQVAMARELGLTVEQLVEELTNIFHEEGENGVL